MITLLPFLMGGLMMPPTPGVCAWTPEYYQIALLPTRRVPEARQAEGAAHVSFVESPFGIAVTRAGHYRYKLELRVSGLREIEGHSYVAWLATPDLKDYQRLGPMPANNVLSTEVYWNKFIVFITLETAAAPEDASWQGPVVMRGMSRSGLMHTMAGHGPYQQEPCTVYGYY
ncbi:MAG: hypothetical protein OXM02_09565 [Bacteroidota bacterium]|nr:hypothetical protein [Bacteroidota bacterium]